jgi:hypothetical protein
MNLRRSMRLWTGLNWLMGSLAGFCKAGNEPSGSTTENREFLYRAVGVEGRNRLQSR